VYDNWRRAYRHGDPAARAVRKLRPYQYRQQKEEKE
jgi:hypothetical protein